MLNRGVLEDVLQTLLEKDHIVELSLDPDGKLEMSLKFNQE